MSDAQGSQSVTGFDGVAVQSMFGPQTSTRPSILSQITDIALKGAIGKVVHGTPKQRKVVLGVVFIGGSTVAIAALVQRYQNDEKFRADCDLVVDGFYARAEALKARFGRGEVDDDIAADDSHSEA